MKKSIVTRKLASSRNLRSEFMITLPDREMLYVTRIFNGQYLMAVKTPSLASRPYDSPFAAGDAARTRSWEEKTVLPLPSLFAIRTRFLPQ